MGVARRLLWVTGVTAVLLFAGYRSLRATSEELDLEQRQAVGRAIGVIDRSGFAREAFVLRTLATYRATDNWWNQYIGHRQAYAATNFPFEVVTLYRPFFETSVDEVERAAILLHEAQHLLGAGEDAALETVWRDKSRLGWRADVYGETRVWRNTREWTTASVPGLFRCGASGREDCVP